MSSLIQAFQKIGNPFLDDFPELIKLDSHNYVDKSVVIALYMPWRKEVLNSTKILSKMYMKIALNQFITLLKRNRMPSSKDLSLKQHQRQARRSKCFRTMWHYLVSCTSQCKVVMVTWRNFFLTRFNCSHPPSNFGKLHLPTTKSDHLNCFEEWHCYCQHITNSWGQHFLWVCRQNL